MLIYQSTNILIAILTKLETTVLLLYLLGKSEPLLN
jgi:hypothetical protein